MWLFVCGFRRVEGGSEIVVEGRVGEGRLSTLIYIQDTALHVRSLSIIRSLLAVNFDDEIYKIRLAFGEYAQEGLLAFVSYINWIRESAK